MKVKATDTFFKSLKRISNSKNPFKYVFWKFKYYDLKAAIKNLIQYFNIVTHMRQWDYIYILEMQKFQLNILKKCLETGNEIDETRLPKIKNIERVIEIINNQIKDDYVKKLGYNYNNQKWVENENGYILEDIDLEISNKNTKIFKSARELEDKEWNEMFEIMKNDMKGWWD